MELTRSEMEIMDVLWETGKPLSRADLLEGQFRTHTAQQSAAEGGHSGGRPCEARQNLWPRIRTDHDPGGILCQHHFQPSPQTRTGRSVQGVAEAGGSHSGRFTATSGACAERNTVNDRRSRLYGSAFLLCRHSAARFSVRFGYTFCFRPP